MTEVKIVIVEIIKYHKIDEETVLNTKKVIYTKTKNYTPCVFEGFQVKNYLNHY